MVSKYVRKSLHSNSPRAKTWIVCEEYGPFDYSGVSNLGASDVYQGQRIYDAQYGLPVIIRIDVVSENK